MIGLYQTQESEKLLRRWSILKISSLSIKTLCMSCFIKLPIAIMLWMIYF